ncbi:MAG: DASS family sodium-coupled anion symporter [Burkholderiaceae bacterium]|nr:DASS family sodium-coupled anion symporter [Burkholderiaceae bacterium]
MNKEKILRWSVPVAILLIIWLMPTPTGLKPEAWHMFAIFAATIAGILAAPIPSGALMFVGLAIAYFTKTLSLNDVLKGFSSGTVWMIFSAYVLSLGFVQSGLGKRIAYKTLSLFGGSSLGVAYSLGLADLIMAPAMPSVTARSGGIILPVAKSINQVLGSQPGPTGRKIGDFLVMTCFQFTPITGAMFMTGMAANPLCATLAKDGLGVELSWGGWLLAAVVPAMICFTLLPLLTYKFMNPELKRTPEAKIMGRNELRKMGNMSRQEILVSIGFIIALIGWGTCLITGLNANAIGLGLVAFLFVTNAVQWKDVLNDKAAWDTVVWFGSIISLATGLTKLGFVKWMSLGFASSLGGLDWISTFIILGFAYIYLHYVFATASGHVAAMYVPFASVAIAAGAPAPMVAICFAIFSNFMWGITEYAGGPGPIYFGQGYFERPRFYKINFCIVTFCVLVVFSTGMLWWKIIGLY